MMSLQSKRGPQTACEPELRIKVATSYPPFLCPGKKLTQKPRTYEERSLIPFCCSEIAPLREPQTKEEKDLVHFISVMTDLDSIPSTDLLPPELSYFLSGNIQFMKCEQLIHDKLSSVTYFMPHPNRVYAYAEIGEDTVVKSMKDKKSRWIAIAFFKSRLSISSRRGIVVLYVFEERGRSEGRRGGGCGKSERVSWHFSDKRGRNDGGLVGFIATI
jgi:hypothetical protein